MTSTIEIKVRSWKRGQKYTCAKCGLGKFTADTEDQICPKCGQKHQVAVYNV